MKKNVLALIVAATMATGAQAALGGWTEGSTGGDINIGGTVTAKEPAVWMWALGTIDALDGLAAAMTDDGAGGKLMTFTAADNIPLIAAKTKAAYLKEGYASKYPKVELTSGGVAVTPVFNANGEVSIPVPAVNTDDNSAVGIFTINAKTSAMAAMQLADDKTNFYPLVSPAGAALEGINAPDGNSGWGYTAMLNYLATMGSATRQEMNTAFTNLVPGAALGLSNSGQAFSPTSTHKVAAISYAMGIPTGNTMVLKTDAELTSNTTWKAPLNIAISYN